MDNVAKMSAFENRTGLYIEIHEERKRRKLIFAAH